MKQNLYGVFTLSETENDFCSETDEMAECDWLLSAISSVALQKSFSVSLSVKTPLARLTPNIFACDTFPLVCHFMTKVPIEINETSPFADVDKNLFWFIPSIFCSE